MPGLSSRMVSFGSGVAVTLHGSERVVPIETIPLTLLVQPKPYRRVHKAADDNRDRIRRLILRSVTKGRKEFNIPAIEEAYREALLQGGNIHTVMSVMVPSILATEKVIRDEAPTILFDILVAGANAGIERGQLVVATEAAAFNVTNPAAVKFAQTQTGSLIKGSVNRQAVRNTIASSMGGNLSPVSASRLIRGSIGLTPRQAGLVQARYNRVLAKSGPIRALRSSEQFGNKLIRARANTIARTESILAANEGQVQLWEQHVSSGILTGREKKEWIVTPDDDLCPICEPLDGEKVGLRESFTVEETGEQVKRPPAHPNCRCAVGLAAATPVDPSSADFVPVNPREIQESRNKIPRRGSKGTQEDFFKVQAALDKEELRIMGFKELRNARINAPTVVIRFEERISGVAGVRNGANGLYWPGQSKIMVGDGPERLAVIDTTAVGKGKYFVSSESVTGTFRHEYGHHIYYEKLSGADRAAWGQLWDDLGSGAGQTSRAVATKSVSEYAGTSVSEFFAETFTQWTSPKKTGALPPSVQKFMKKHVGVKGPPLAKRNPFPSERPPNFRGR